VVNNGTLIEPWIVRPLLLADRAQDATRPAGCTLCPHGIRAGQRIAQLPGGGWAHTWCAAPAAPGGQDRARRRTRLRQHGEHRDDLT
jgi:hypothetical protein